MNEQIKKRISAINIGIIPDGYKKTKVGIVPVEWEECHFKKMFARLKRKNTENNTNVLTISAQYGLINQEEFFNKSVASENKSNYFLLHKGDFAYNKSYSNGYPFGAIKSLKKYDKGVVSPLYICFSPTVGNSCPDFYLHYFENGLMNREIQAIAQEGARNHGLLNIGIDDFFNSYLIIPPLPEQQKIAEILSTQDKLIELYERKIEQLKTLKKGYLQKMFPKKGCKYSELRFKGFTEPWEQRELRELGEIITGSTPPTSMPEYYSEDGIPWVTPTDIDNCTISDSPKKLSALGQKIGRVVPANTILCTCIASIGKNTLLTVKGSFNQQINSLTPNDKNEPYFLLTESTMWSDTMKKMAASGTMQIVNKTEFSELKTMVPELKEQKIIGAFFFYLDRLITLHQHKLDKEKQKKKALMQLLLTGKVRVST